MDTTQPTRSATPAVPNIIQPGIRMWNNVGSVGEIPPPRYGILHVRLTMCFINLVGLYMMDPSQVIYIEVICQLKHGHRFKQHWGPMNHWGR